MTDPRDWLEEEIVRLARLVQYGRHDRAIADAVTGYPALTLKVDEYLAAHPGATANAVWRAVGGRRQDVLRIVRTTRAGSGTVPDSEPTA